MPGAWCRWTTLERRYLTIRLSRLAVTREQTAARQVAGSHLLGALEHLSGFDPPRKLWRRICSFEVKRQHFERYGLALADETDFHLFEASRIAPLPRTQELLTEAIDRART